MIRPLILVLLVLTASCGILRPPEERAKRKIKKLLKKYPEISQVESTTTIDTVIRLDSFFTKEVSIDTTFFFNSDTIFVVSEGGVSTEVQVINKESIRVKTLVRADTIYYRDTLIRENTIIREVLQPVKKSFLGKYWLFLIFGLVIIGFVIHNKMNLN